MNPTSRSAMHLWTIILARTISNSLVEDKVHPRTGHVGPEGECRYSSIFFILGVRWGGLSTPRSDRFTPGKTRYPLYRRLGGHQGRSGRLRKISPPTGFDPRTVQPVASRYTDWAIPVRKVTNTSKNVTAAAATCGPRQFPSGPWSL